MKDEQKKVTTEQARLDRIERVLCAIAMSLPIVDNSEIHSLDMADNRHFTPDQVTALRRKFYDSSTEHQGVVDFVLDQSKIEIAAETTDQLQRQAAADAAAVAEVRRVAQDKIDRLKKETAEAESALASNEQDRKSVV